MCPVTAALVVTKAKTRGKQSIEVSGMPWVNVVVDSSMSKSSAWTLCGQRKTTHSFDDQQFPASLGKAPSHDAAGSHIRNQRYPDAINMLMRFALACDASHATSSQCKAYLGAVVVALYAGKATEAWATYQVKHVKVLLASASAEAHVAVTLLPGLLAAASLDLMLQQAACICLAWL